ncbi:hypothetical protein H8E88_36250 [candidate division KSB1 bacterium]|nr:hypothetical protein [candidate division KSB1 bacterium]MBL7093673.1 hypothetical protein [candidate division KSB1 bacterium]
MKKLAIHFISLIIFITLSCDDPTDETNTNKLINFSHLEHLTETITLNGQSVDIIHIYSEYPNYDWVDASSEGIACIDDVARAAVVNLRYFELFGDSTVIARAKRLLQFVMALQADDGEFYNFIFSDGSINKNGRTSKKSFDFWAVRGYWALAKGYKVFKTIDKKFADDLRQSFLKCKIPIQKILTNYHQTIEINGFSYPVWLVNRFGSDATSELLLGIAEYLSIDTDDELPSATNKLCEGILKMQLPETHQYAGAFLSWKNVWHGWGNSQTQALASLYPILQDERLINAAQLEASLFFSRLLVEGRIKQINLENEIEIFPQIAYDIRCQALGLLELYKITGEKKYAKLAGITASWLTGNNAVGMQIYNSATGRCFDGINDSTSVNKNSGAESTIEALFTLIEITSNPIAKKYLDFKSIKSQVTKDESGKAIKISRTFENNHGNQLILNYNFSLRQFDIVEEN